MDGITLQYFIIHSFAFSSMTWSKLGLRDLLHGGSNRDRQGSVHMRTFEQNNESADWWSAVHSYYFIIRKK